MIDIHIEMWLTDHSNNLNKSCICTKIIKTLLQYMLELADSLQGLIKSLNHDEFSMIHNVTFQNTVN
ncbi:hypothetical protein IMY05_004G0072900 [Salix suchowensis]|nr:hypothetical protein IMY05_004G0072900 [Salix suchowensis]